MTTPVIVLCYLIYFTILLPTATSIWPDFIKCSALYLQCCFSKEILVIVLVFVIVFVLLQKIIGWG